MLRRNALVADSGYRNILRKVSSGSVLHMPALPEGFEQGVIKDYSGNNNHGTITGATWTRLPSGLMALNFNGASNFISIPASASLNPASFTLSFWIKTSTTSTALFNGNGGVANGLEIFITAADGFIRIIKTTVAWVITGTIGVADNKWHKVTVTKDALENYALFIDGVSDGTGTVAALTWADWWIGKGEVGSAFYNGMAWGAFGCNRVQTPAEIANNYQREHHLFGV